MKIAILGAGVAGISSAIALKLKGFDVEIYERHTAESNIGAGIVIWPNAAFVLDQLGMLDEIKRVSGCPKEMKRFSSDGDSLGFIDIKAINRLMGYSSYSILRTDLHAILIDRLRSLGINICYDHQVVRITEQGLQNVVHFNNGRQLTADALIGADGRMASQARRCIAGDNQPKYQCFINWIGILKSSKPLFSEIAVRDYWGIGERFGIVPINQNCCYWAGGAQSSNIDVKQPEQYKTELKRIFSGWPDPIEQIIEQTLLEKINKIYVHDHDQTSVWHRGNFIMIGDAAHAALPTSGQGACQALEDAWHLGNCFAENSINIDRAYSEFTNIRLAKTGGITNAGRGLATSLFNRDENFCKVRNENSKKADPLATATAMANGWSHGLPLAHL